MMQQNNSNTINAFTLCFILLYHHDIWAAEKPLITLNRLSQLLNVRIYCITGKCFFIINCGPNLNVLNWIYKWQNIMNEWRQSWNQGYVWSYNVMGNSISKPLRVWNNVQHLPICVQPKAYNKKANFQKLPNIFLAAIYAEHLITHIFCSALQINAGFSTQMRFQRAHNMKATFCRFPFFNHTLTFKKNALGNIWNVT